MARETRRGPNGEVFREAWQKAALDEFFKLAGEEAELRDLIEYLIQHREAMRDVELRRLESEVEDLIGRLRRAKKRQLLEEVQAFRDVLELQKRLLSDGRAR